MNMNHHNVNMMYLINERVNRECLLAEEAVAVEEYLNMQNQVSKVVQNQPFLTKMEFMRPSLLAQWDMRYGVGRWKTLEIMYPRGSVRGHVIKMSIFSFCLVLMLYCGVVRCLVLQVLKLNVTFSLYF